MFFLAIGSNLPSKYGDRFDNINQTISYLEFNKIKVIKKSSFYETPSYPNIQNPKFINVIIEVDTLLSPEELAATLIDIELKLERKRLKKNEPRTCDIDIIDYDGKNINFSYKNYEFFVPHEKIAERNFVLFPLQEIAPNWVHPKTKEKISTLIEKLPDDIRKSILKVKKS